MARFRFKLEAVLKHRIALEDQAQNDLAKSLRQKMILQQGFRTMQQTIRDSKGRLSDGLQGQVNVERISMFARYSGQVETRARQMVVKLAALEQQIQGRRQVLAEAVRDRKAIALLRDRHFQQWKLQAQRAENTVLDELMNQQVAHEILAEVRP